MTPEEIAQLVQQYVDAGIEPPPELVAMLGSAGAYAREARPDYYGNQNQNFSDSAIQEMTMGGGDLGIGTGPGAYAPRFAGWYNPTPGIQPGQDIHPTQGMGGMTSGEQVVMGGGGPMMGRDTDVSVVRSGRGIYPDPGFHFQPGQPMPGADNNMTVGPGYEDPGFMLDPETEQKARMVQNGGGPDAAEVLRFILREKDREQQGQPQPAARVASTPAAQRAAPVMQYKPAPAAAPARQFNAAPKPAARGAAASRLLGR